MQFHSPLLPYLARQYLCFGNFFTNSLPVPAAMPATSIPLNPAPIRRGNPSPPQSGLFCRRSPVIHNRNFRVFIAIFINKIVALFTQVKNRCVFLIISPYNLQRDRRDACPTPSRFGDRRGGGGNACPTSGTRRHRPERLRPHTPFLLPLPACGEEVGGWGSSAHCTAHKHRHLICTSQLPASQKPTPPHPQKRKNWKLIRLHNQPTNTSEVREKRQPRPKCRQPRQATPR
jgi:hypothetical protein